MATWLRMVSVNVFSQPTKAIIGKRLHSLVGRYMGGKKNMNIPVSIFKENLSF